ncbi:MAG: PhnA domain-containing protein [Saprospiraceae bacterium]|nr:PhnA domain-containing protein [Saprospiraceae bacterium]MCF8250641.1 PhnA domain-containing protein [Saprospiraceae bacterium]MCF8312493.1 PhnA domain-containing protein [Saprospiraceae bacterium]MCF8440827.1 PhnA domain-containing protein [Saprospiraceae bacterium]
MTNEEILQQRSGSTCELCKATETLTPYTVAPKSGDNADEMTLLCDTCRTQIEDPSLADENHWRCLNDSMWSEVPAVKVLAWRMLDHLRPVGWPAELIDMLYLDDETLAWAKSGQSAADQEPEQKHVDCNGVELENGDTIVLTKDLDVKGASFAAKRGTAVRNIRLVFDNPEQIEGKVNGQQIVILTKYVKK